MKLQSLVLLFSLIAFALACSSTGTTTISKDAYGNVSGEWRLVVDDNGYASWVWVAFSKPFAVEIEEGCMTCNGSGLGTISPYSARLILGSRICEFLVCPIDEDYLLLVSCEEDVPDFRLIRATLPEE